MTDIATPSIETRLQALTAVNEQMPHLDHTEAMRIAEWMVTGSVLLDPARVDRAARELASQLDGLNSPKANAQMRGYVQRVLVAYHSDDA